MEVDFRVANYGPENVSDEIILQRKKFNLMSRDIASLYQKQVSEEKISSCKSSKDIYILINLSFDVLGNGCGKDVGDDYIEFWSRIFVDFSSFKTLNERDKKKCISNKIMEALLYLSKEKDWKLETTIIQLNSSVNTTFL